MNLVKNNFDEKINNKWIITLRGILLVAFGCYLFLVNKDGNISMLLLAVLPFLAGIFGLYFLTNNHAVGQISKNWLRVESIGDILLGCAFFYLFLQNMNTIANLRNVFAVFAILFCFMQLIFLFQIAESGFRDNAKIVLLRGLTAIGYALFGVILLYKDEGSLLSLLVSCIGAGPILSGIACIRHFGYNLKK